MFGLGDQFKPAASPQVKATVEVTESVDAESEDELAALRAARFTRFLM